MRSYIAKSYGLVTAGGWGYCLNWAVDRIREDSSPLVKIHVVRAGEKQARVVAELTSEGIRLIPNGRYVSLRKLRGANGKR